MSITAFLGVYASGRAAYRSANELGAMTADYLNLQVDSFLREYAQILGDAAHTVGAMPDQGMSTSQIEQWLTEFSDQYAAQMCYDESGLYGSIRGQAVYSSGWVPPPGYDMTSRPWYLKAVEGGGACVRSEVYQDYQYGTAILSLSMLLSDGVSVLALDIRAGDIQVDWQKSGDLFPGTATIIEQNGNLVLHQQIRQDKHARCELDQFTQQDFQQWMTNTLWMTGATSSGTGRRIPTRTTISSTRRAGPASSPFPVPPSPRTPPRSSISNEEDRARFLERFSAENLEHLRTASDRCYMEYQLQTSSGPRWASAEGFWVPDLSADSHVILAFRAIHTEKAKSLEQTQMLRTSLEHARLASQAKNDFLSRMSHDMRTPMNAVMGFTDMARNNLEQPERARECLDKVSAASAQLLHLINEVLDTAKIEQGKMELHLAPVDLRRHLEETAAMFQMQAQTNHQEFSMELSLPASTMILTDGNRLNQILNNLLTNAIKYTPAGGRIKL